MSERGAFEFCLELLERVVTARGGDASTAVAAYAAAAARQGAAPPAMTALGSMLTGASGDTVGAASSLGTESQIVPVPQGLGATRVR